MKSMNRMIGMIGMIGTMGIKNNVFELLEVFRNLLRINMESSQIKSYNFYYE